MGSPSDKKHVIDPELLSILACPETHQGLRMASADELSKLNARIRGGSVKNQAGKGVAEPFEDGLMREDGKRIYPIRDGIPVLFIDEGVPL